MQVPQFILEMPKSDSEDYSSLAGEELHGSRTMPPQTPIQEQNHGERGHRLSSASLGSDFTSVWSHDWVEYEKISHKHYHQVPQDSDLTICTFTLPYRWHQLMHTSSRSPLRLASRTLQRLFLSKKSNSSPPTPQMDEAWGRFTKTGSSMPTPFHLSLLIF